MTGSRLGHLGPEQAKKLIATAPLLARGEHRQERQPASLVSVIAENSIVRGPNESERSEGPKPEYWRRACVA